MNVIPLNLTQHLDYIEKNNYKNVVDSIIGDMLMNKVKLVEGILKVNINNVVFNLIHEWYEIAVSLKKNEENEKNNLKNIIVYRGVYDMKETEENILQPIPFSTSLLISSCYNWIENRDNSFIMKIHIPIKNLFTFIGNKNEGYEIVLSAGFLKKRMDKNNEISETYDNKKIIEYDFESIDFLEMKNIIKNLNS
jgi:hypothetical protein